ncbi:ferritin-like domain-containing protein [Vararia minispora EC-137]|uniref:Ferritin-like domain-containing protein n=1 Tax=Vararia minispora EC-137 TaxID=1314806 RepID=A0ACB8Q7I2_9AGAM|nr:ferritin-like domain-containing protein [Vararia minispora EC-137]
MPRTKLLLRTQAVHRVRIILLTVFCRFLTGFFVDVQILNYALTLEHLENAFYSGGLANYSQDDFAKAGFAPFVRGRFEQIAAHEASHVALLQQALGDQATHPCNYTFPYDTVQGFVILSATFEQVGTSAYTGASKYISDKENLLVSASILSTEARQASWVEADVRKGSPWGTAYETPLDFNQAFTLASPFITSCPSSNPELPATAYPALSTNGTAIAGGTIGLNYTAPSSNDTLYAIFLNGLTPTVTALNLTKTQVAIPDTLRGFTYLYISTDSTGNNISKTVAGPTVLDLSFDPNNQPALLNSQF